MQLWFNRSQSTTRTDWEIEMPHHETGDDGRDQEAADRAFVDRMRNTYRRLHEIEAATQALDAERRSLLAAVCKDIGATAGDVLETRTGKVLVVRATGEFHVDWSAAIDAPHRVYPAARCKVAPATKGGFHSRTRELYTHIDRETWFWAKDGLPIDA